MMYQINHPWATGVSVVTKKEMRLAYATNDGTLVEVAFFDQDGDWVTKVMPEFAEYAEGIYTFDDENEERDTLVYAWVPNELVEKFLEKFSV